ncbi:MAG: class I SAM-dependent methyltransferase [Acidimicrobiales bacterium]
MTQDPMMAAAMKLSSSVDALAALAAHARVHGEGLDVDPQVRRLLDDVVAELTGTDGSQPAGAPVVGLAQTLMRLGSDMVANPDRSGAWDHVDPVLLQGIGRMSGSIATAFAAAADSLAGLGDALAAEGASFLDVGTGTGWLAIATAQAFPSLRVLGVDLFEVPLELARGNVEAEGLTDRVELRLTDVLRMEGDETFDAIWVPLPFLPREIVPDVIAAVAGRLKPGGWLLPGSFAGPPDRLSTLLVELRTVRSGGKVWSTDEIVALMEANGLADAHEVPRTWPAPVYLFAGRRP